MDTNIIAALVSAGVSLILTGFYWFYKKIRAHCKKGRIFREYKKHLTDFLESYRIFLEKETINWGKHSHNPKDLKILFIAGTGNVEKDIKRGHVPAALFALWAEQDLRNEKETELFSIILRRFISEDVCFFGAKELDDKGQKIPITGYHIIKNTEFLAGVKCVNRGFISCYSSATLDRIKNHLSQLKMGSYDGRIKKIIANTADINALP